MISSKGYVTVMIKRHVYHVWPDKNRICITGDYMICQREANPVLWDRIMELAKAQIHRAELRKQRLLNLATMNTVS